MDTYFGLNIKKIREFWGLSQAEMGHISKATRGMIMQYEKRGSVPKDETIETFEEITGFSRKDLFEREIDRSEIKPLKDEQILALESLSLSMKNLSVAMSAGDEIRIKKAFGGKEDNGLIAVPIAAQAGYGKNYLDPVYLNQLERIYVPGSPYRGDHFRYFEVDGDSMDPTLKDKMNVLAERVPQENWQSVFNYYIYVIVLESQILIKRLYRLDERTFVAVSDNEEMYPQFTIDMKDVKELWLVKRKLDWDMMPPRNFDIKVKKAN